MTAIQETSSFRQKPEAGTMLVQLLTPGVGSSGVYSPEVVEAAARSRAFPAGTLMFADHPTAAQNLDRPERSITEVAGVLLEDARWDGEALIAEARTYTPWTSVLTEMKDAIGVSIRAAATISGKDDQGRNLIESIDRGVSVDFVTLPGRGGRIREVYESARDTAPILVRESVQEISSTAPTPEIKENAVGTVNIEESRLAILEEASAKLAEAETAQAAAEEALRLEQNLTTALRRQVNTGTVDRILSESDYNFNLLERRGLTANLPLKKDGSLDEDLFTSDVRAAVAQVQEARGDGQVKDLGTPDPVDSGADLSESDFDKLMAGASGRTQEG